MDSLKELSEKIDEFNKERDWDQFHSPANLAKSISIEANELLECFQWSDANYDINDVKEELADVLSYCIQMATKLDLDIREIVLQKMEKTAKKSLEIAKIVPNDLFMLETDSPYISPEPHRNEENNSSNIKYIVQRVSEVKGLSYEEIETLSNQNAMRLFKKLK